MERQNFATESPWEPVVGYSRAVRVGNIVHVAGTTAPEAGNAGAQTAEALNKIRVALERAGASLEHVVRTRIYVTNIDEWEAIGRAHGAVFGNIRPVSTMVEVSRLIDPAMRVEIEAEAIIP